MVHFMFVTLAPSYVAPMYSYATRILLYVCMYWYVTRKYPMLLVCTRVLLVCTRMLLVCSRMLLVCTRKLLVCARVTRLLLVYTLVVF